MELAYGIISLMSLQDYENSAQHVNTIHTIL